MGVGPHVINGVLDELEREGTRTLSDRLTLRPFPYAITDPEKRRVRWTRYRTEMVSKSGIAIFVFGNTVDRSGRIVSAEGMLEEFKIATESGLVVVPVGSTGYVAEMIPQDCFGGSSQIFSRCKRYENGSRCVSAEGNSY